MDSKLEAHIDEIFQDVPKTDKMVTMINRIKSKANAKYLQIRDQGYSRNVAYNEVDDWLMKAKVIVDEEAGKLTPAEIAAIPKKDNDARGTVVSESAIGDTAAVVVERDEAVVPPAEPAFGNVDMTYGADPGFAAPAVDTPAPADDAPVPLEEALKPAKKEKAPKAPKEKKSKKSKKGEPEVEEEELKVPVKSSGKVGKIIGAVSLVAGAALIVVAVLMLMSII